MGWASCNEFVQFGENGRETRNSVYHRIKEVTGLDVDAQTVQVTSWEFVYSLDRYVAKGAVFFVRGDGWKRIGFEGFEVSNA